MSSTTPPHPYDTTASGSTSELPTRADREAAKQAEHSAAKERLAALVGKVVEASSGAQTARRVESDLRAGQAARAPSAKEERTRAAQLTASHGERQRAHEQPGPEALAQNAKPPPHIPYSDQREKKAAQAARESATRAGLRDAGVHWPGWVRDLARRVCESKGRALSELSALPGWARDSVLREARKRGGADTIAGRNMLALSIVLWHVGGRLRGRVSGMPREAYTSLTVGAHGRHYSHSTIWHPVHDADGPLLEHARGPEGGRIGDGRNCGLMVAVRLAGWLRTIVPASFGLAPWLISPSGWPFVQVLVSTADPGDTS